MPKLPSIVPDGDYQKLLTGIRAEMTKGLKRIEELIERQKVMSSWNVGRQINTYLKTHDMPRGSLGPFYDGLARDLDSNPRTLQQCEQFFREFPKLKPHPYLKWSHYRFLMTIDDLARRRIWIDRIIKDRIPPDELRLKLAGPALRKAGASDILKEPVRGKLYTYRLLRADEIENFDAPWFVDLGFAGRQEAPPSAGRLDNKYLYTSEKFKDGYRLLATDSKVETLFTYRAKCRRVIDGDTLLVLVDQGFGIWNEQRLRLFGIDAPEMTTMAGERAKKWLESELNNCADIVVKTYKSDQWDRYLVDVFYAPKVTDLHRVAAEGRWLNQAMVTAGMAGIWKSQGG